jgi:enoyl-CoA hydratase/carnithine racemase
MSLKISREGRVTRLTLARPEKRNALDEALCAALVEAFEQPCGCFLLDAEGPVFCAGMDLESASPSATRLHERLFTIGAQSGVPIVCAVNGPALGGGLGLVANAHIAVAAQGAQFGLTEIRVGMWPFVIWPSVTAALGERRAMMLALTGRLFGSTEALQWGFAHEVVPPVELDDRATAIAAAIAESSRTAIELGLRLAREAQDHPLEETTRAAMLLREQAFASPDFAEGVAAFREKRRPRFPSIQ